MSLPERERASWDLTKLGQQNLGLHECPVCMEKPQIFFTDCLHPICSSCISEMHRQHGLAFPCPICRSLVVDVL
jgi:hypothetical protein